jgi:hypothetical protein
MGTEPSKPAGPDLALGIPVDSLLDGQMLAGHVGDDSVLLEHVPADLNRRDSQGRVGGRV